MADPSRPVGQPIAVRAKAATVQRGVLRYRLLGVEVVIRRTLQFAVLTLLVVAVYAAATAAMSALVSDATGSRVVAAAAVALVLLPLRDRLQTWVDRLVYGARRIRSALSSRSARRSRR